MIVGRGGDKPMAEYLVSMFLEECEFNECAHSGQKVFVGRPIPNRLDCCALCRCLGHYEQLTCEQRPSRDFCLLAFDPAVSDQGWEISDLVIRCFLRGAAPIEAHLG